MKVLEQARSDPRKVKELFKLDVDIEVKVEEVDKIMTESEKTLHRLENELDRLNINSSTRQ
jgi:divalent metal cation (Fe/Co/Zn/Cd) transporter